MVSIKSRDDFFVHNYVNSNYISWVIQFLDSSRSITQPTNRQEREKGSKTYIIFPVFVEVLTGLTHLLPITWHLLRIVIFIPLLTPRMINLMHNLRDQLRSVNMTSSRIIIKRIFNFLLRDGNPSVREEEVNESLDAQKGDDCKNYEGEREENGDGAAHDLACCTAELSL